VRVSGFALVMISLIGTSIALLIWLCIALSQALDWPLWVTALVMSSSSLTLFAVAVGIGELLIWRRGRMIIAMNAITVPKARTVPVTVPKARTVPRRHTPYN